jgi:hypothetical protein
MAAPEEGPRIDITAFIEEISDGLLTELADRFLGYSELPPRDVHAIAAAVTKAAQEGILRGVSLGPNPELVHIDEAVFLNETDGWDEKYGDSGGDEG